MRPAKAQGFVLAEGNWWGGSTHKGNTIYLHILRWPSDTVSLPAMPRRIVRHTLLGGGEATVKQTESGVQVSVPAMRRNPVDTIVKLELDGPANTLPVLREG
jgi:alpha-L-fucosidase